MATTSVNLKKSEMVYNFTFNVPKTCNYADKTDLFIECRAQFVNMNQDGTPLFFVDIEHLNVVVCSVIKWDTVSKYIQELAEVHFSSMIKYAKRESTDIREQ